MKIDGDAVLDLADVLEFLRPKLKETLLSKDEQDLFNIAKKFGNSSSQNGSESRVRQGDLVELGVLLLSGHNPCGRSIDRESKRDGLTPH